MLHEPPPRTEAQAALARIASDILNGELPPGHRLKLQTLCEAYAVGMSPLREALSALVGQGLVDQEGQRGFRVAGASLDDFRDVTFNRLHAESLALGLAIERGGADWEARLIAAHHRLSRHTRTSERLVDRGWEDLHRTFHLTLVDACGSQRLIAFCRGLHDLADRYRRLAVLSAGRHPAAAVGHAALIAAAIDRRTDEALHLLHEHIAGSANAIVALLEAGGALGTAVAEGSGRTRQRNGASGAA